jgi:hypothetical protein
VIEKGMIRKEEITETFFEYPWMAKLEKTNVFREEACFSPSIGFTKISTGRSVKFSIVGGVQQTEFYIFYKRKNRFLLFGFFKTTVKEYLSGITGQRFENATAFPAALLKGDEEYMVTQRKRK